MIINKIIIIILINNIPVILYELLLYNPIPVQKVYIYLNLYQLMQNYEEPIYNYIIKINKFN